MLLCVVLHACFNVAMASAGLRAEQALQRWDYILLLGLSAATIWAGVAVLIKLTGGRLGREDVRPDLPTGESTHTAARELVPA